MATQDKRVRSSSHAKRVRQLIPYNEQRGDAIIAYMARKHGKSLTQRDIVKLQVMVDVFHVLYFGKPVIGGSIFRWKGGAVNDQAYARFRAFGGKWERSQIQPDHFEIVGKENKKFIFRPTLNVDGNEFSKSEHIAMERAWDVVMNVTYKESDEFFHSDKTFMGRAYIKAKDQDNPIRWEDIIDAYAELNPGYNLGKHIKVLVSI